MSELKLTADSGGGTVSLKGPATTTGNAAVPFVLPVADGSAGQFLKTDGSKNLSFATGGGDNTPSFNVRNSADQVVSHNTHTQVTLDTEDWDTDNAFASSTFTCPADKTGKYIVVGAVRAHPSWATTNQFNVAIFRNGASNTGGFSSQNIVASKGNSMVAVSIINMAAGDTLKLYLYHDEGGTEDLQAGQESTYFAGTRITE